MSIDSIINGILDIEGEDFTNDSRDSGGPTKWGITLDTLSKYRATTCTAADVENLARREAFNVYEWLYVRRPGLDAAIAVSPAIGAELVDTGVNCGAPRAVIFLQRALNAFNQNATKYPDVDVDGEMGPGTLRALKAFIDWRGPQGGIVLLKALNCLQGEYYLELSEKRPKDEAFVYGWFAARVGLPS